MVSTLLRHREIWNKKPLLRKIYYDWYRMMLKDMVKGKTVELGSGSGNFKEFMPEIIASDIEPRPWLDKVFDAHKIPFRQGSISNLVMVDVFHHLANPIHFLGEAARVLKKGGRLIMIEPFPSPFSLLIYKYFHPEPFIFGVDYFKLKNESYKLPWESNQAIPYLVFFKNLQKFKFRSKLKILKREKFSFLTYPLSGGFEKKQLYPTTAKSGLDMAEILFFPFRSLLAFRCYVVLEKP